MKSKIERKKEDVYYLEERIRRELDESGLAIIRSEREFLECKQALDEINADYANVRLPDGRDFYIVMKEELRDALFDPSSDDLDLLRKARDRLRDALRASGGKLMIRESPLERSINDRYIKSLIMNIIEYPKDRPFEENLEQLGLFDKEIRELYGQALAAWLGSDDDASLDLEGFRYSIEKVGYTGVDETINLDTNICYAGSHYTLKIEVRKIQEKVNKEAVEINEEYLNIERRIVEWVQKNAKKEQIRNNARNLVRMTLNLFSLYEKGKPLPLE